MPGTSGERAQARAEGSSHAIISRAGKFEIRNSAGVLGGIPNS
jgi:hypothetical protein